MSDDIKDTGTGGNLPVCFARDTLIKTRDAEVRVQDLAIGDMIIAQDGRAAAIKWIGRQTYEPALVGPHGEPVRISKNALGQGVPHTDLIVTGRHGICIGGIIVVAAALVNHTTISFVPLAELPAQLTVFHIETEAHEAILANGVAAESLPFGFAVRKLFDNHQEYLDLYGAERIIPEMTKPRILTQRMLPKDLRAKLNILDPVYRSGEQAQAKIA